MWLDRLHNGHLVECLCNLSYPESSNMEIAMMDSAINIEEFNRYDTNEKVIEKWFT